MPSRAVNQLCLVHDPVLHPNVGAEERVKIVCRNYKLVVACSDVRLIRHIRTSGDRVEIEDSSWIITSGYSDLDIVVGNFVDRREPPSADNVVEKLGVRHRT